MIPDTIKPEMEKYAVRRGLGWVEYNFDPGKLNSQTPLVSVSVTTYQHADYIAQTLHSILSQKTDFPFEILLGEDCSKDNTRNICIDFARQYPHLIRLFLHDRSQVIKINGRPTGRFNWMTNLESARGTFVALCEGDDYWNDDSKLQKQVDFLTSNPEYSLSFHDCSTVDSTGNIINPLFLGENGSDRSQHALIRGGNVPTLTAMFRRKDLQSLPQVFLSVFNADTFIFAFLGQKGPAKFQPEIQPASYRVHAGGVWSSANSMQRTNELVRTFRAIAESTDDEFRDIAMAELKSRYSTRLLACFWYFQFGEIITASRECISIFGWTSFPGILIRMVSLRRLRFIAPTSNKTLMGKTIRIGRRVVTGMGGLFRRP